MKSGELCKAQKVFLQVLEDQPLAGLKSVVAFEREDNYPGFVLFFEHTPSDADAHQVLQRYFLVQDLTQWPDAVYFLSDDTARYLRSKNNLWEFEPWGEYALLPPDLKRLAESSWIVFGKELKLTPPSNLQTDLPQLPFTRSELLEAAIERPSLFAPFLDNRGIWRRQEHIVSRPQLLEFFQTQLRRWQRKQSTYHLHLYGRVWGLGKTQTMYEWMRVCKVEQTPFVYKMWAAKDAAGTIMDDSSHLNTPAAVAAWIRAHAQNTPFVLFLDEVEVDPTEFPECLIISGGKELHEFIRKDSSKWKILDMIQEFPLEKTSLLRLLQTTIMTTREAAQLFSQQILERIAKNTHIRGFSQLQPVPLLIRALAYSIMMGIKRKGLNLHRLMKEDVNWGIRLASCPWFTHYGEFHDIHSEYFVFDGQKYTLIDPFNPSFIP